jgi:hypothetical protein
VTKFAVVHLTYQSETRPRTRERILPRLFGIQMPRYCERHRISNAVGYANFCSRSQMAVIRVYDQAGNVIETHEHAGDFKSFSLVKRRALIVKARPWIHPNSMKHFPSSRRAAAIHIVRSLARWFGRRGFDFLAASLPVAVWSPPPLKLRHITQSK